jgi:hypothetical protein
MQQRQWNDFIDRYEIVYLNINLLLSVVWDIFDVYDFSAVASDFEARLE